jgi:hypothetical protein
MASGSLSKRMPKRDVENRETSSPKEINKIWLVNDVSASVIFAAQVAKKYNLAREEDVIVEETDAGILIRKRKS